jgi:catechol 2,3-dioxygenase-like lactoylglutathione lyase family enzyme
MCRFHHVAVFTSNYARMLGFLREVFDAEGPDVCRQPSVVECGSARLHLFEVEAVAPEAAAPARLHHVALEAEDLDAFLRLRERLIARGACDERIFDFGVGPHVSLLADDPDGGMLELLVAVSPGTELPFVVEPGATL